MNECNKCGRGYFREPHTCGKRITQPAPRKREPSGRHEILTLAFDQLFEKGIIEELEGHYYRLR